MFTIVHQDITETSADILVNASNGVGYMGGFIGKYIKLRGVAESIHFATKGRVEKEAKKACKKNKYLPRHLCGHKPGEIFITRAGGLSANYIIHAVTMLYPGMKSSYETVEKLLSEILLKAQELGAKSIVIPLLGTGTGKVSKEKVLKLFEQSFANTDLNIMICMP